jgi:2-polyprenyl-3-methyl-5-hydroxy-6-metoxy-1,4-benzoquinol methylase
VISPGKTRYIGADYPQAAYFGTILHNQFSLASAEDPDAFLRTVDRWASKGAYDTWLAAYKANSGNFLDHPVWGADRNLGNGIYLYGAMDDRWATNAHRVFKPGGLEAGTHVAGKKVCVIGAWDGTECLLLRALGAAQVDAVDEVPAFCDMATAQYMAWKVPGRVIQGSLYELLDADHLWQFYDLVYVPGVLYHLTDLPTAMTILWALLKPGGTLAFESVADASSGTHSARYCGPSQPGWNWWSPNLSCYEALMKDCGFPDGRTVDFSRGRGWWMGTKGDNPKSLSNGAAGFSRPDVIATINRLRSQNV